MSNTVTPLKPNRVKNDALIGQENDQAALVGDRLSLLNFHQLAGMMAGYSFVKVVVERKEGRVHFINNESYAFHADYIAERIKGIPRESLRADIDDFNKLVYLSPERPYYLGILALHKNKDASFFTLETVEIDNMDAGLLEHFFSVVKNQLDPLFPVYFKPANHLQENTIEQIEAEKIPRLYNHELFSTRDYVPLNPGSAEGRLRVLSEDDYKREVASIKWYDIVLMKRIPDNIPRVSGMINDIHTTPLSHTNVLATGWQIPNAVQVGVFERAMKDQLGGKWVRLKVDPKAFAIDLVQIDTPAVIPEKPSWSTVHIDIEEPETQNTPIVNLELLRMTDKYRYGTKAANLGELQHLIRHGSRKITGFYRVPRPPRADLLQYLATYIGTPVDDKLNENAWKFLCNAIQVPRGIAIPFSFQQEFLQSSWKIQQCIGKLKMALELNAREIDALCLQLQQLIRSTRMCDEMRDQIDENIANNLSGVRNFVVRSSSNAEDLKDFSAAGIYESINHVSTAEKIFASIKEVWASLVSPRSVRLRHDVGISLDDSYMGVIIQEEAQSDMGGVMVTVNPMNTADFRNVYINASDKSAIEIVTGDEPAHQYLYNTVESGGRTLAVGRSGQDLHASQKAVLQRLSYCGRLLQSHFSQDYTFSSPVDIEWAALGDQIFILQLRPYTV